MLRNFRGSSLLHRCILLTWRRVNADVSGLRKLRYLELVFRLPGLGSDKCWFRYFEIQRSAPLWDELGRSSGLASSWLDLRFFSLDGTRPKAWRHPFLQPVCRSRLPVTSVNQQRVNNQARQPHSQIRLGPRQSLVHLAMDTGGLASAESRSTNATSVSSRVCCRWPPLKPALDPKCALTAKIGVGCPDS